jgi:hypothetical protein
MPATAGARFLPWPRWSLLMVKDNSPSAGTTAEQAGRPSRGFAGTGVADATSVSVFPRCRIRLLPAKRIGVLAVKDRPGVGRRG